MNNFEKLINASDLIDWIMETYPDWCEGVVRTIIDHVDEMPPAELEHTGQWVFNQYDANPQIGNWHCSECKNITIMPHYVCNYCPHCGAKMEGEE